MTSEELEQDCEEFYKYLEANGVRVLAHIVYTDIKLLGAGTSEMIDEAIMHIQADRLGYKLIGK